MPISAPPLVGSTVCFASENVIWDLWYRARAIDISMLALPTRRKVSPRVGLFQVPRCTAAGRRKPKGASQKEACLFCREQRVPRGGVRTQMPQPGGEDG